MNIRFTDPFDKQTMSVHQASLLGDQRELEPPESISNSEVKRFIADGSVRFPHVRVGHRQAFIQKKCSS